MSKHRLRPEQRREAPASVYVMTGGGKTKIGIATDPKLRKRQIQTSAGVEIVLRSSREFSTRLSARHVEAQLHKQFGRHRRLGEWFECDAHQVVVALMAAADPELHTEDYRNGVPMEEIGSAWARWEARRRKGIGTITIRA